MWKTFRWTAWILTSAVLASMAGAAAPRNLPKAIETQIELLHQRPQDPKVANDLGNLLVLAGRLEEAESAYQRAIELAPSDSVPLYNLALLKQRQGNTKEALSTFKSVLELDRGNAWAHYQVGALYELLGEKPRAVAAYGKAFALNPELASSDVNPQVIDSRWVIEAMLRGFRRAGAQPLAPQAYDDPNRIAMLMISSPDTELEESDPQLAANPSAGPEPKGAGAVRGRAGTAADAGPGSTSDSREASPDPVDSADGSRRVLTSDNIEKGGTLGQVGPAGSAGVRGRRPTATRRSSAPFTATRRSDGSSEQPTLNPSSRNTGRTRYRPSIRSTGSLDVELIPGPDTVVPAG